jgi:hypothetical protein
MFRTKLLASTYLVKTMTGKVELVNIQILYFLLFILRVLEKRGVDRYV